jgi:hypothetical protein
MKLIRCLVQESQENSPFVIKYFCKLKVDLTEDILNHFNLYYNLNEVDVKIPISR